MGRIDFGERGRKGEEWCFGLEVLLKSFKTMSFWTPTAYASNLTFCEKSASSEQTFGNTRLSKAALKNAQGNEQQYSQKNYLAKYHIFKPLENCIFSSGNDDPTFAKK